MNKLQPFPGGVKSLFKQAAVLALALLLFSLFMMLFRGKEATKAQADAPSVSTASLHHELHSGLWRVDGGFISSLRIKNSLTVGPLDVMPVLYMSDGTPYTLPLVHLPIAGVATVNVSAALAAAPPQIAAHRSTFGSAALHYSYSTPGHVLGSVEILDLAQSLIFTYPFTGVAEAEASLQTLEGLWWRHQPEVGGFVSLANTTPQPVQVSLQGLGSAGTAVPVLGVKLLPRASALVELDRLLEGLPGLENRAGGLRIQYEGREGDVIVSGGLVNERIGYSANMPFGLRAHHQGQPTNITYASVGIMVGKADTAAGFPSGTRFAPYAALRNTTPNPLLVRLGVNYMASSQPVTRALPAVPLAPFETRYFTSELFEAVGLRDFTGMINLSASFEGRPGDLVLATGSTDLSGTYVFAVEPQGLGRSFSKEGHYWKAADGFDTMFTLWNPTDKQQDLLVTFFFGQGEAPYKLPVTLGRNASTTIDVSKLIAAQQPDEDGNVIPFGTREGSVVFSSAQGMTQWMTLAISIGILNAQAATCGGICTNCCGYTGFGVTPSPGYCPLGLTAQCGAQATYCSGVVYSFTTSSSWSSSNTSVLTVNNTTQKGLVTGVAPGTATVTALFPSTIVFTGTICGDNTPTCPTSRPAPGGPVTVLKVQVTSADVTQDKIGLTLSPGNLSGNLRLELIGPGITHTIRYVTRSSGTYNETFDIPNLPEKEFLTVRASWEVSGTAALGTLNYHFRKLGTYRHSQYNVPRESACGGSASNVYIITLLSGCFNNYVSTTLRSDFVSQTNINGTGISLNYGTVKALAATSCNSATQNRPPDAAGKTFVQVSSITGSCNTTLTSLSLARCTNNPIVPLACSDRIYIKGLEAIKTIADSCPACCSWPEQKQLDNFNAEKNVCQNQNGSIYDLGNFVTFKLY